MKYKLWEYVGKQVKVVFNDGIVYEGKAKDFDDGRR
jgi:small nuclear ribonucleoprotein (snRNP)-like protein